MTATAARLTASQKAAMKVLSAEGTQLARTMGLFLSARRFVVTDHTGTIVKINERTLRALADKGLIESTHERRSDRRDAWMIWRVTPRTSPDTTPGQDEEHTRS